MSGEVRQLTVRLDVRRGDTSGIDHVNKSLNQAVSNSSKAEKSANAVARAYKAITIGLPAGISFGILAKKAIDYHDALIDVRKKVDDFGKGGIEGFEKFVSELRKNVNMSRVDILKLAEIIGASGKQGEELKTMMETVAKASSAFQMSVEDTWGTMNSIASQFKLTADEYKEFADATAYLDNKTGANAKNTLSSIQRFGGLAKEFGLSWRQALGMSAAMLEIVGPENVEQAATAWRELLQTFGAADVGSRNFLAGFDRLNMGITTRQFDAMRVQDPAKALGLLIDKIKDLKEIDRLAVIKQLFGGGLSTSAIAAMARDWDRVAKNIGYANDKLAQHGYLEGQAAQEMTKTMAKIRKIIDALGDNTIAKTLLEDFNDVLEVVLKIMEAMNKTPPWVGELITAIAEFAALAGVVAKLGKWGIKGAEKATNWYLRKSATKGEGFIMHSGLKDFSKVVNNVGKIGMGVAGATVAGKKGYDYYQDYKNPGESNNTTNSNKSVVINNQYNNTFEGSKSGYQDFFNMLEGSQRKQSVVASTLSP